MTAGEAWTQEVLAELRAAGYRPAAWRAFLTRSFARATATRALRVREHRQLLGFEALGLAAWATVALTGQVWLALAAAVWLTSLLLMVDWHLGMLEDDTGRELQGLGPANLLSLLRGALVPALFSVPPTALAVLLAAAGASDALDGPLARARGQESRLGRWLDGGVDGCLLAAAAVASARLGLLPYWAAGFVVGRHLVQWFALAFAYFSRARPPSREGFISGKGPGLALFSGLALAAVHQPGATVIVVAGAFAGVTTVAFTVARTLRLEAVTG